MGYEIDSVSCDEEEGMRDRQQRERKEAEAAAVRDYKRLSLSFAGDYHL
jgi:hypothetical protein